MSEAGIERERIRQMVAAALNGEEYSVVEMAHDLTYALDVNDRLDRQMQEAVKAEREWCESIIDADRRDAGDGRIVATLANMARVRLREIGSQ